MSTNSLRTAALLAVLTALFIGVGYVLAGTGGMIMGFTFALVMNFVSYWFSDSLILKMSRAKEVSEAEAPLLHSIVDELAMYARIPKPRVYIMEQEQPNAFATGRSPSHAAVAVTTGIMQILDREELFGVLAHEISHVKNRDTLTSTIVATLAGAITMLTWWAQWALIFGGGRDRNNQGNMIVGLIAIILAPIAATLIQLGISRSREYEADRTGALISGKPEALASALEKLEMGAQRIPMKVPEGAAALFIVNPLRGKSMGNLFSTHPPTAERVARLRSMSPHALGR